MRVVLYSAIYDNYDTPRAVPEDLGCKAIMFTDNPELIAPGWDIKLWRLPALSTPMMRAKWWKCHPWTVDPDAGISLWLDGAMTILAPDYVDRCVDALGNDDWTMTPHPWRDCIYDEAALSATLPRYAGEKLHEQAAHYRERFVHPEHWGLWANGANVRRHTNEVKAVCDRWWWEMTHWTHQDQVSLPVVVRNSELKWNVGMPWGQWWHSAGH